MSSSTSSSSSSTLPSTPPYRRVPLSRHSLKQLKFVLPGAVVTYVLNTLSRLWWLVEEGNGWARVSARISLACGVLTVALFLYIILVPLIKGTQPNYGQWRQSGELSVVVPALTSLIVVGWPLLSFTLSHWTELGFIKGTMASLALYALVFGLLGLLPAPMVKRQ